MGLTQAIATLPLWLSGLLVVVLPTAIAMCGPAVVRHFFSADVVAVNNEVAGFKFATLGVIYAVLLGLAVISVWEKFSDAEAATVKEAGAIASVFRLASGLPDDQATALNTALARYAETVITDDWPAMARGGTSPVPSAALNQVYSAALALPTDSPRTDVILSATLDQLDSITEARRERLTLANGILPGVIWLVLFIGALLTIGFTFFFGLTSLRAQATMTGMLALVIFLALFVAITIGHPFTGTARVTPGALERVLADFTTPHH